MSVCGSLHLLHLLPEEVCPVIIWHENELRVQQIIIRNSRIDFFLFSFLLFFFLLLLRPVIFMFGSTLGFWAIQGWCWQLSVYGEQPSSISQVWIHSLLYFTSALASKFPNRFWTANLSFSRWLNSSCIFQCFSCSKNLAWTLSA